VAEARQKSVSFLPTFAFSWICRFYSLKRWWGRGFFGRYRSFRMTAVTESGMLKTENGIFENLLFVNFAILRPRKTGDSSVGTRKRNAENRKRNLWKFAFSWI